MVLAAKPWLPICCLWTAILGLGSVEMVFGFSYPAYPKRTMRTEVTNMLSESISKSERSWPEQPFRALNSKRGFDHDDANIYPTKGGATAEQMQVLPKDAEFLDRVEKMQFFKGRQTSHKRSWPIPQLQCKDGCDNYEPSMVQCTNVKSPDQEVAKWRCEADLPRHLKFQKTTINCEGFESVEDNRILRGSCGLEYSLTHSGLKQIPGRVHRHFYTVANEDHDDNMGGWTASWLVVIGVIVYLIWNSFKTPGSDSILTKSGIINLHNFGNIDGMVRVFEWMH